MAEMVSAQPELVAPILGDPGAVDIARLVTEAVGRGEPVVIAGCGTSEHGAQAIARLLDAGLRQRGLRGGLVEARQALEAAVDPRPGGLFVAVSHDGGTRATLLAAEAARHAGARVALVTANAQGQIAAYADAVVVTPLRDRSWCHTMAYSSVILAGGAVAALAEATLDPGSLRASLAAAVVEDGRGGTFAAGLWGKRPLLACGAGVNETSACELALKVEESPRLPCIARHLESLLHGHLAACDAVTELVLLGVDPAGSRRDARLALSARAAVRVGMAAAAVLAAAAAKVAAEAEDW